jgi:predicted dehydrogenase
LHLLILGHSSIVRRRVLPAARAVPALRRISVASRHAHPTTGDDLQWFTDYDEALASSGADLAYVSGVNASHTEWATRALQRGLHVVVDKPAFPDAETAWRLVTLSRQQAKGLAEATVFTFHPQVAALQSMTKDASRSSTRVMMTFSVPPFPAGDFRYRADCGGGCLYDLGPYVVATNRMLLGRPPSGVHCEILTTTSAGPRTRPTSSDDTSFGGSVVDTSFSAMLTHDDGAALTAHCGFVTAYQNRLSVLTDERAIDVERFFTTPPDFVNTLKVRDAGGERSVDVPAADAFVGFLNAFCDAVERSDFEPFQSALLDDAQLMERLRRAAGRI